MMQDAVTFSLMNAYGKFTEKEQWDNLKLVKEIAEEI